MGPNLESRIGLNFSGVRLALLVFLVTSCKGASFASDTAIKKTAVTNKSKTTATASPSPSNSASIKVVEDFGGANKTKPKLPPLPQKPTAPVPPPPVPSAPIVIPPPAPVPPPPLPPPPPEEVDNPPPPPALPATEDECINRLRGPGVPDYSQGLIFKMLDNVMNACEAYVTCYHMGGGQVRSGQRAPDEIAACFPLAPYWRIIDDFQERNLINVCQQAHYSLFDIPTATVEEWQNLHYVICWLPM